jgi:hypothetical protein
MATGEGEGETARCEKYSSKKRRQIVISIGIGIVNRVESKNKFTSNYIFSPFKGTSVVIYSQMRERNSHKRALGGQPIK